jgi:DNA-binding NtrC family response regulator
MAGTSKERILIVEDTTSMAELYRAYLEKAGFDVDVAATGAQALRSIEEAPPGAIVLDLNLPDMSGLAILDKVVAAKLASNVVVVTTDGSIKIAVEAMRKGAHDFIVKPFSADRLVTTVSNARESALLKSQVAELRGTFGRRSFQGFVGESLAMQAVYRAIESAAPSNATVFVTGESGTGKELCAEAVHKLSRRAGGPFVAINCAAIPRDLIESELFGHVKGAFSGAIADRDGAVKQANGGTLFLDEIGEMHVELQSKLLRFLQTGDYRPVGANRDEKSDLRVVCATNRDPLAEVAAGRFREDLYYRLHVVPIELPPLREREDDVRLIAEALLSRYAREESKRFTRFAPDALDALRAQGWPGNVRQLQNVLRNAIVMHDGEEVTAAMLPLARASEPAPSLHRNIAALRDLSKQATSDRSDPAAWRVVADIVPLVDIERAAVERAIAICEGNVPRAAAYLGVSPSTLYRKKQGWEAA